jgi:clan AA aspartic protease
MLTGRVDDYGRALLPLVLRHPVTQATITVEAWIDTAFTGSLLLTADHIGALSLPRSSVLPGTVADGSSVLFETHSCQLDWFGRQLSVQAIRASGRFALIGVGLLENCTLTIEYPDRRVSLSHSSAGAANP